MSKFLSVFLSLCIFALLLTPHKVHAAENPLAVANNKIGIHILDVTELDQAAKLVNSNGGQWGYVLIPIQAGDKDLIKWQAFMDACKKSHVIPIIRLATEGDYFNQAVWRQPNPNDVVDFANFLNSLDWPTKNRYVIVFNEVNRGDEWGGNANASTYAQLLSFAISVFKSKSSDFFMISAGLDNAAPDQGSVYINEYTYINQMNQAVPGIFNQLDGVSSHSYPNPGFSQPPDTSNPKGVASFAFEREAIKKMTSKNLPIFITETGWSAEVVPEEKRITYYDQTFKTIWSDSNIVAITPFLLRAGAGPFAKFTFITPAGSPTKQYNFIASMPKVKGVPSFPTRKVLGAHDKDMVYQMKDFSKYVAYKRSFSVVNVMEDVFAYIINK